MEDEKVSLEQWRELYEAAIELKERKPWEWMWDSEIFGVQNPETGEVGYCCVMGRGGEHFALAAYLGSEGLDGVLKLSSGELDPDSPDTMHCQKCLMVSFEDRDLLEQKDRKIIKSLGLKFRGDNAWPKFRSWIPGYVPWFITPEEARYFLRFIPQALEVTERFKEDLMLLIPPEPGQYLVRVPREGPNDLIWEDEWKFPAPLPEPVDISKYSTALKKIRETIPRGRYIWELDYFYSSKTVRENQERPYFPRTMFCVDHESGMILFFHIIPHGPRWRDDFIEAFLEKLETMETLPAKILTKENGFALFEALTAGLGIAIELVDDLPVMKEVRTLMEQFG